MTVTISFWHSFAKWIVHFDWSFYVFQTFSSRIKLLNQNRDGSKSLAVSFTVWYSANQALVHPGNQTTPTTPTVWPTLNLRAGARPGTNWFSYFNSDNSHWERERERKKERWDEGNISNDFEPCLSQMACRNPVLHLRLLKWNELRLIEKCI